MCLKQNANNKCPDCREPYTLDASTKVNARVQKKIWSMRVRCEHHGEGCDAVHEIGTEERNLIQHRAVCDHDIVPCTLRGCHEQFQRRLLAAHMKEQCDHRRVACGVCKQRMTHSALVAHSNHSEFGCANMMLCSYGCTTEEAQSESKTSTKGSASSISKSKTRQFGFLKSHLFLCFLFEYNDMIRCLYLCFLCRRVPFACLRSGMRAHLAACYMRPGRCPLCDVSMPHILIDLHNQDPKALALHVSMLQKQLQLEVAKKEVPAKMRRHSYKENS